MTNQVKEKLEGKKPSRRGKTLTLTGIPGAVNEKMKAFQQKISFERGKKFNLKSAYVEFLKEAVKSSK